MRTVCFLIFVLFAVELYGQTAGQQKKRITFEKTINVFELIKRRIGKTDELKKQAFDRYQATQEQFHKSYSELFFDENYSCYTPMRDKNPLKGMAGELIFGAQPNIVFSDFGKKSRIIEKDLLGSKYLINDSSQKIIWKITNETREIAGYICRRANGLILDSVYVVAFFTPQIPVPAGPESFASLPGMILGVALPHEHVTWFATKVDYLQDSFIIQPPKSGKKVSAAQFRTIIKDFAGKVSPAERDDVKAFSL